MTTTTAPPSEILRQLLIIKGLGVLPSTREKTDPWPVYISHEPDGDEEDTNLITIYDVSGVKDGRLMTGSLVQHPGCQIRIRSRPFLVGWSRAKAIFELFESVLREELVIDTITYSIQNISITSPILPLGIMEDDTKKRDIFTLNVLLTINEEE